MPFGHRVQALGLVEFDQYIDMCIVYKDKVVCYIYYFMYILYTIYTFDRRVVASVVKSVAASEVFYIVASAEI